MKKVLLEYGDPDEVNIRDLSLYYDNNFAFPFLKNLQLNNGKYIFGEDGGGTHNDLLSYTYFDESYCNLTSDEKLQLIQLRKQDTIEGRIWVLPNNMKQMIGADAVISTWDDLDESKKDELLEVCKYYNVNANDTYYSSVYSDYWVGNHSLTISNELDALFNDPLLNDIKIDNFDEYRDNRKKIHLLPPEEKRETPQIKDFLAGRNEKWNKKLMMHDKDGNEKGVMPMAQWHHLIYQEEKDIEQEHPEEKDEFMLSAPDGTFGCSHVVENTNKKTIYINEDKLSLLKEGISDVLYHFTTLENLIYILRDDTLKGDYIGRISFARNFNSTIGYSSKNNPYNTHVSEFNRCVVRIEVDGRLIGYNYKGNAYNDFGQIRDYKKQSDKENNHIENQNQKIENEDMVDTIKHNKEISNFSKYIKKIDILFRTIPENWISEYINELDEVQNLCPQVNVFFDEKEFNKKGLVGYSVEEAMGLIYDYAIPSEINENVEYNNEEINQIIIEETEDGYLFKKCNVPIGQVILNINNLSEINNEYNDTLDGEIDLYNIFNYNEKVVNIEDIWVYKQYLGQGFFRTMIEKLMEKLNKYSQIILRACSDNGFPLDKLVSIYQDYGFKQIAETEDDGVVMIKKNKLNENVEYEVAPSEIDTSSFEINDELAPEIWRGEELNPQIRLKLLDIADDFFNTLEISWVKPIDIILTGSICNFNWSKYSDIDLHIVLDYREVDEHTDFVKTFFDSKKNEWNEQHNSLEIFGFLVELYVQDISEDAISDGVYSLEKNEWIKKPTKDDFNDLSTVDESKIKLAASSLMTLIDNIEDEFNTIEDKHQLELLKQKIEHLTKKLKNIRQNSLDKNGEISTGNIVYKILRRTEYLNKIWDISDKIYDKINSINEGKKITLYHCSSDINNSTRNGIWLSDYPDNSYGKQEFSCNLDLSTINIASDKIVIEYIKKYDITTLEQALEDEYLEPSLYGTEQNIEEIPYIAWCEIMEHPYYYNFYRYLKEDGYEGYNFKFIDMGITNYYFIFDAAKIKPLLNG